MCALRESQIATEAPSRQATLKARLGAHALVMSFGQQRKKTCLDGAFQAPILSKVEFLEFFIINFDYVTICNK